MYGWMGTILQVDLSSGKIESKPLSDELRLNYLGGRGINSRILYDSVGSEVDALSPDNVLVFGTGPVVGTTAPSAGRITVSAKSPLTGILGDGNAGGDFSLEMKRAGYDHIVIKGKSERPVYLLVANDRVELRPADGLWGKGTQATEDEIRRELRDSEIKIASIGLGGENRVRFATVIFDSYRAGGRPGIGAVMGSKNLKAIAVKGTKPVKVYNPEAFVRVSRDIQERIVGYKLYWGLAKYGTSCMAKELYESGWLACKNGLTNVWPGIQNITHKVMKRDYFVKSLACTACPRHCSQAWVVKDGPYAGIRGGTYELTALGFVGAGCLISDPAALLMITHLCDEYGLDIIELGNSLSSTMEWYEKGLITKEDLGEVDLVWGNAEAAIEMIHKIARREGFGNVLAEGVVRAANVVGKDADKFIVCHSKGMTFGEEDLRVLKGYALAAATGNRGADHLRGMPGFEMVAFVTTPEYLEEKFGSAEVGVPNSYNKAPLVVYCQDIASLADCLEICKYQTEWVGEVMNTKDMSTLFSLATGVEMDEKAIRIAASRVYTLERAFLVREGITRKDDVLKGRYGNEPIPDGPSKGERLDPKKFAKLRDEFYGLRGWDENGIPTPATLSALDLEDVSEEMRKASQTAAVGK